MQSWTLYIQCSIEYISSMGLNVLKSKQEKTESTTIGSLSNRAISSFLFLLNDIRDDESDGLGKALIDPNRGV